MIEYLKGLSDGEVAVLLVGAAVIFNYLFFCGLAFAIGGCSAVGVKKS